MPLYSPTGIPADGSVTNAKVSASAAIAGSKLATDVVNDYHSILSAGAGIGGGNATGTYVLCSTPSPGNTLWSAADLRVLSPVFYIDPADYGISGYTTYANLDASIYCNNVAPGTQTFTVGLYPISSVQGGNAVITATIGTVTSGSTCAFVNPTASTKNHVNSTDFAFPAAGHYGLGFVNSATTAANTITMINARLRWRIST